MIILMEKIKNIHELDFTGFSPERTIALLKAQQEAAIDGILVIDENKEVLSFNTRFLQIWEVPEELAREGSDDALLGSVIAKLQDPDAFISKIMYLYEHIEETSRDEIYLKNGVVLDRYSSPIFDDEHHYLGRIWYFRDITEKKKSELDLLERTTMLQETLEEINQINEELHTTLEKTRKQEESITEQNKKITASITYAKRIQEAILPSNNRLHESLENHFVIWKPRDIVSGDFYWFEKLDDKMILAVADCTGHGVPGAFMSMLGSQALSHITSNGILDPELILSEMHQTVRAALKQESNQNRDGLELAICVIDLPTQTLTYAGAGLPLYIVQNNNFQVIKADKYTIGGARKYQKRDFTKHTIKLDAPIQFYLATDGFQDQIGGEGHRKFLTKNFRTLLQNTHYQPFNLQQEFLENSLINWQGSCRQIDDILVFGCSLDLTS